MTYLLLLRRASAVCCRLLLAVSLLAGSASFVHADDDPPAAEAVESEAAPAESPAEEPKPADDAPAEPATAEDAPSSDPMPDEANSADPKPADPPPPEPKPEEPKPEADNPAEPQPEQPKPEKPKPEPKKPQPKDFIATSLDEVDADFAYQGEYATAGRYGFGLQVVALGGGKFSAVLYPGGLPGAGWSRGAKYEFKGELENDLLYLAGEPYSLKVRGNYAELLHRGWHAGFLTKTQRTSPTMHAPPARGAKVLFDGTSADAFEKGKLTPEGWLAAGTSTKDKFGDFRMHLEFRLPYKPYASGQGRGNSGVYIQRRYEVQVLDSFGLEGAFNECGALYRQKAPDVNMCLPPLSWQTYDITFRAARFDADGKKTENARITILHNGYPVQSHYELTGKTGAGQQEAPDPREIYLQDHGNPVAFRNIWIVEGDAADDVNACQPCYPPCIRIKRHCGLFRR